MLSRVLFLLFTLFSHTVYAYDAPIEIIEYMDNTKIIAFINEADINTTKAWQPADGAPPLTIHGALKAIEKQASAYPELQDCVLSEIKLKPIPHHEKYWHYIVKMTSVHNTKSQAHYVIVLMNGKVFPGLKEPQMLK